MKTSGDIRIFANTFIGKLVRPDKISREDIRWVKDKNGQFPLKFVWDGKPGAQGSTYKEIPYLLDETFIVFDVIEEKNIASERIGNKITSKLPFRIIINVYGADSPAEIQYMMAKLHTFGIRSWLWANKAVIDSEPSDIIILDGRENAQFWIRRRIEIPMSMVQEFEWEEDELDYEINSIALNEIKNIGDK